MQARDHQGDLTLDADVVVVGSGASGMVVASELAAAGQRVVILEEGQFVPHEEQGRMRPTESLRHLWRDGGMTMAYGIGDSPVINVTIGKAVGGSSLFTGGVCFRPPAFVFREWERDRGLPQLSLEKMEPCFDAVEKAVSVHEVPESMRSRSTVLFGEGAKKLGYSIKPTKRNTEGCLGQGRCNFGCPHGAKMSVDQSFMPKALKAGARIYSDVLVEKVVTKGDRAVGVRGRLLNGGNGSKGGRITVHAKRVVVAAGAWHSPLLLRRSGVGRTSEHLGRHMTLHPSFRVMGRFDEKVEGWRGAMQSAWSDEFEKDRITLVSLFLPPGILAATLPGIGEKHREMAELIPYLAVFGGLIHDEGGGRIWPSPGREPWVTYKMDPGDRASVPKMMRIMADTYFAAGAREVYLPVLGLGAVTPDRLRTLDLEHIPMALMECSSQHPLGTCRMGRHGDDSVVSQTGESWEVKDLYVVDGSVLPTSLGVNPQITIMSMAMKLAWGMRDKPLPAAAA